MTPPTGSSKLRSQYRLGRRARARLRRMLRSIVTLHGSPEAIAFGVTIGVFVAFTPTVGLQMVIAAFLATLCGANRFAAVVPVWITNPVTIPPIYAFTYWLGRFFCQGPGATKVYHILGDIVRKLETHGFYEFWDQFRQFLKVGADLFVPMLIGGVIVGVILGAGAYPITLRAVRRYRARRARRRAARARRLAAAPPDNSGALADND